ncbi:hypothetical protein [Stutzerimonas xanthomarina]|uniref:hypothetical protein n=1 Tax=Stutzerimonas xanthomarina TaxID=271420 RepID=UPI003AA9D45F
MSSDSYDKRKLHALRAYIDALLAAGASLEGRDPVRLSFEGETLIVRHGMLVSENDQHAVIEALSDITWASERQRNQAIEMCLHHLTKALDETELALEHWAYEEV